MQERPNKSALLAAIARFLSEEARPALSDPRLAFRALIAANLAGIVAAELASEGDHVAAELTRARSVLGETSMPLPQRAEVRRAELVEANRRLAAFLKSNAPAPDDLTRIHDHLMQTLQAKLAVDNPRFDLSREIE